MTTTPLTRRQRKRLDKLQAKEQYTAVEVQVPQSVFSAYNRVCAGVDPQTVLKELDDETWITVYSLVSIHLMTEPDGISKQSQWNFVDVVHRKMRGQAQRLGIEPLLKPGLRPLRPQRHAP